MSSNDRQGDRRQETGDRRRESPLRGLLGVCLALPGAVAAQSGAEPSDAAGATPLHWAAHEGDTEAVARLIEGGSDVDAVTRYGVTVLALAAAGGHTAAVEALLVAGADPNLASGEGEPPLLIAARTGVVESVASLIGHGADVDARETWRGQTALMWAAAEGHAVVVGPLVAAGADVDTRSTDGFTSLAFAVRAGHTVAVEAFLDAGADINRTLPNGTSPLVIAVINAHYDLAVRMLERGADPNAAGQGWTALHQLVWTRRPNLGYNNPPAFPTGFVTDEALFTALVAHGADINARQTKEPRDGYRNSLNRIGATPFLLAAKAVDVELMRLLLDLGADPLLANEDGTTPMMAAAGVGIWSVGESPGTAEEALAAVKLMLELGDSVTTVDANGDTALHGAVMRDSKELLLFLVEQGAAINPVNEKGWTPLTIAQGIFYSNLGRRWPEMETVLLGLGATSPTAPEAIR